jgi:hypothetical protein
MLGRLGEHDSQECSRAVVNATMVSALDQRMLASPTACPLDTVKPTAVQRGSIQLGTF